MCLCFQGFGEAVELPDAAGLLREAGLCLQSAAGQQTSFCCVSAAEGKVYICFTYGSDTVTPVRFSHFFCVFDLRALISKKLIPDQFE